MAKNSNTYKTFNINERTPSGFFNQLDEEFHFDFDPCPLKDNPDFDGLLIDWGKRCYINPPYGKAIRGWLEKALLEIQKGNTELAVFLLPSYTDVKWFHEVLLPKAYEIRFLKGRLKFGEHSNTAPFANLIAVFRKGSNSSQS
jgi:hypothetical protein